MRLGLPLELSEKLGLLEGLEVTLGVPDELIVELGLMDGLAVELGLLEELIVELGLLEELVVDVPVLERVVVMLLEIDSLALSDILRVADGDAEEVCESEPVLVTVPVDDCERLADIDCVSEGVTEGLEVALAL